MTSGKIKTRNYGIDCLRMISMFYVVILHTLDAGGILEAASPGSAMYYIGWFMQAWAFCAVDIFVIISGYVGYSDVPKKKAFSDYMNLWIEVVFYNVVISAFVQFARPESADSQILIASFFPVSTELYWYFTAYTALFFVMPLLNAGIRACSEDSLRKLLILIFLLFTVYESVFHLFKTHGGYSFVWLILLYIIGAILKKCGIGKKLHFRKQL